MPTSWPLALTRAPPLLPGLIAASVWIALVTTGSPLLLVLAERVLAAASASWPGASPGGSAR